MPVPPHCQNPAMPIGKLDHYSIRTLDIEASRRFYTEIMGFEVGFRPDFERNLPRFPSVTSFP